MEVVKPVTFTNAMVTTNSLTDAYAAWLNQPYSVGNRVTHANKYWECISAIAGGSEPGTPAGAGKWLELSSSNKWSPFDEKISSQGTATTSMTFVFKPGLIDTLAILNVTGATATVTVKDSTGGTVVYSEAQNLTGSDVFDWYQYFYFDVNTVRTMAVFRNIPMFGDCEVTLTITAPSGAPVALGLIVTGSSTVLGGTQYGLTAGIQDFSKKETDETFGTTEFIRRGYSKKISTILTIDTPNINRVQRTLYGLRATPSLWIASSDPLLEEMSVVYGFYRDFETEISFPTYAACSLEIEGLI